MRTRTGLAATAANGRKGGRPRKVDDAAAAKARNLRAKGINATDIAKMFGVCRATVYRTILRFLLLRISAWDQVSRANGTYWLASGLGRSIVTCQRRGARRQESGRTHLVVTHSASVNRIRWEATLLAENDV